jgi:hypothetical protein
MRVPARFHVFVSLAVAALAALGVEHLLARRPAAAGRRRLAAASVLALLALDLAPVGVRWWPIHGEAELPPVYAWLAGRGDVRALLELPWNDPGAEHAEARDIQIMYRGTRHWRPLVNGYSGFVPARYRWLRDRCCRPVPEGEALAALRDWGVTHVLVHRRQLPHGWQRQALARWERTAGVRTVYAQGGDRVYDIRARRRSAPRPG